MYTFFANQSFEIHFKNANYKYPKGVKRDKVQRKWLFDINFADKKCEST
jgi:hypothetical protein